MQTVCRLVSLLDADNFDLCIVWRPAQSPFNDSIQEKLSKSELSPMKISLRSKKSHAVIEREPKFADQRRAISTQRGFIFMKLNSQLLITNLVFSLTLSLASFGDDHAAKAEKSGEAKHDVHWAYEGEHGPNSWGEMNAEWNLCSKGHKQSPIDLKWKKPSTGRSISFFYNSSPAEIIDNGHTIQVNLKPGSKVDLDGKVYDLVQFHFHTESEHTIASKHFPLELHFVHKNEAGELAVVGVLFKVGEENESIDKLWKEIPKTKEKAVAFSSKTFDPARFLPSKTTHYHYEGSLTTPPCSEGVNWNVLNTPVELSEKQLQAFQKLYVKNNRPIQSLHSRKPANF
jgi:carbonic anhydrase